MTSLFNAAIKSQVDKTLNKALAPDGWLRLQIKRHIGWIVQGFAPGFELKHREAFTETVAARIYDRARSHRVRFFGVPLWRVRYSEEWCAATAETLVTEWLRTEKIKFGDPRYIWSDGYDIADEDMSYWETCS